MFILNKKIVVFSIFICNFAVAESVPPENRNLIPSNMPAIIYYDLGGAEALRLPNYNKSRFRFRAAVGINGAMMCNSFNPSVSMENLLNGVKQGWATTQRNMVNSIQGTIASLPMLAIQKIRPGLYEYMTNGMNAAENQFQLEVASCEKITRDVKNGSYVDGWVKASGYEELSTYFSGDPATSTPSKSKNADAGEMVKNSEANMGKTGTTWMCGEKRGGEGQPPIVLSEVVVASYNRLIGRGNCEGLAPADSAVNPAFVSYWPKPADAQAWFVDVFGETNIRTDPNSAPIDSKPGAGLMAKIDEKSVDIASNLKNIVEEQIDGNTPSINAIREVSAPGVLMSVEVIRSLATNKDAGMLINRLASEVSAQREIAKAFEMRRLLISATNITEVMQNPITKDLVSEWVLRIGDEVKMVKEEVEIRKIFSQNTVPTILRMNTDAVLRAVN